MFLTPVLSKTMYSTDLIQESPIVLLPAKPGTSYRVHGVTIAARNTAGTASVGQSCYGYIGGSQVILAYAMLNPSQVDHNEVHVSGSPVDMDSETSLYTYASGAVPASSVISVMYQELHI